MYRYGEKDAKLHLKECLSSFLPNYYNNKNKTKSVRGCQEIRKEYEHALRLASGNLKIPANYSPPDCEDANALIATWTGRDPVNHPCAGFDPNDVTGHITECFDIPASAVLLQKVRTCPDARRTYEQQLREAYGDLPPDYTMAKCSELESVVTLAKKRHAEATSEAQKWAHQKAERKAKERAIANRRMNELALEAQRVHQSTHSAATSRLNTN